MNSKTVLLSKLAKFKNGKFLNKKYLMNGQYLIYGANGPIGKTDKFLYEKPVIIIGRVGANCGTINRTKNKSWITDNCIIAIPKFGSDFNFLYYTLKNLNLHHLAIGCAQPMLTQDILNSTAVYSTNMSKQQKIGGIFYNLDSQIENLQKQNKILEQIARTTFKSWFVDFNGVTEFEDSKLGKIPKKWLVKTIDQWASINPESWSRTNNSERVEYVDLRNVKWGVIECTQHFLWNDAPSRARRILHSGDTIVGTVRPANGSYSLITTDGLTGSTGFTVLRPRNPTYREFIYLAVTSPENIERLAHHADGAAYPAVQSNVIGKTKVAAPYSDTYIIKFSKIVSPLLNKIAFNRTEFRTLSTLRDILIPKLMSGEIMI